MPRDWANIEDRLKNLIIDMNWCISFCGNCGECYDFTSGKCNGARTIKDRITKQLVGFRKSVSDLVGNYVKKGG